MYYLPTDYLVLTAIRDKKVALDALLEAASAALPYPLPKDEPDKDGKQNPK